LPANVGGDAPSFLVAVIPIAVPLPALDRGCGPEDGGRVCQRRRHAPDRKHDRVERVLARQHRAEGQPGRQDDRQILAAVDGEVDVAGQETVFDFLHEETLAADLRQRRVGEPVARCLDHDDPDAG
jgi:hypothetical protein